MTNNSCSGSLALVLCRLAAKIDQDLKFKPNGCNPYLIQSKQVHLKKRTKPELTQIESSLARNFPNNTSIYKKSLLN